MMYFSLNGNAPEVSFKEAVIKGLAPDYGLYFPKKITALEKVFFDTIEHLTDKEIAYQSIVQFVGDDIPPVELKRIVSETLCFDFPVISIEKNIFALELFHGPTMAFKDVGARFMARCLGYFNRERSSEEGRITILVATSGDTGGAVADGFLGVEGVEVIILYPKGKVSEIQEKQLTTLGQNITALEVDGVFDDCQNMVKQAFPDKDFTNKNLTSANSINVARWLPQMFYFLFAYKYLKKSLEKSPVFSVPSGNFGNVCAGIMAHTLGLPIKGFVASTNINDTVPRYLKTGHYEPLPSLQTISNAMDVGDPSNFVRIRQLYGNHPEILNKPFASYAFTDKQTREAMQNIYKTSKYIADPHGAVAYLGAKEYLNQHPETPCVFLETAHPSKFLDVVESTLPVKVPIPKQIKAVLGKEKKSIRIQSYKEFKDFLLSKN